MQLNRLFFAAGIALAATTITACNNENKQEKPAETAASKDIKGENVTYKSDSLSMQGYVAYDNAVEGKRPVVLIIPEWWGVTDYVRGRARQLAELGYLAFVVDMYGNGKVAEGPDSADAWSGVFYKDAPLAKKRFDAALNQALTYAQADASKKAAIGYCFGGAMVLNIARLGEDLNGVVSFHGNLPVIPTTKEALKAKILVCHGEADGFIKPEEITAFRKQLDSLGASYEFKSYPGAQHAFTNPDATANGKKFGIPISYNAAADTASWNDMKAFFKTIF